MVLVDTSVWVDHFRKGNDQLVSLLNDGDVICHHFIIGELACGNLKNRSEILSLLQALPTVLHASHDEVMTFIETNKLMGNGLGYIDIHLLACALLSNAHLWSFDKKLNDMAKKINERPGTGKLNI